MTVGYTSDELAELISRALRAELRLEETEYVLTLPSRGGTEPTQVSLPAERLQGIIESLQSKEVEEETTVFSRRDYQVLVREHSTYGLPFLFRRDDLVQEDETNGVVYTLAPPGDEYTIFFVIKLEENDALATLTQGIGRHRLTRYLDRHDGDPDVFELLRATFPRLMTLELKSSRNRSASDFSNLANAFLFQLSYNLDISLVQQRHIDEIIRSGRISRNRRSRVDEIDAPRRTYEVDLIHHYQMGVASEDPALEFLSYYHVAEHYFDSVFNDDLINQIKDLITKPDFSYRRKKDVSKIIKSVTRRVKLQNETVTFSEAEALRLTLQKFVNLDDLKEAVQTYDSDLVNYYKSNEVSFSGANTANLDDEDDSRALASIASRIYKTRNAIVHSKEGDKGRYIPFKNDTELIKEVPLIRFIAELIIIETSQVVGS